MFSREQKKKHFSVINIDDPGGSELLQVACGTIMRYGVEKRGEIWPQQMEESEEGLRARVSTPRGTWAIHSPLIGRHNLYNILAAVSVGEALGLPAQAIATGIEKLSRVPGRLERIPGGTAFGYSLTMPIPVMRWQWRWTPCVESR